MREVLRIVKGMETVFLNVVLAILFVIVVVEWVVCRRWREPRDMRIYRFL